MDDPTTEIDEEEDQQQHNNNNINNHETITNSSPQPPQQQQQQPIQKIVGPLLRTLVQAEILWDVIVIGGGLAGLSTIYHLLSALRSQNNSMQNIKILMLESNSIKLGGRI